MHAQPIARLTGMLLAGMAPVASAQVTPVRSSLDTRSWIGLTVVELNDEETRSHDQGAMISTLGPHATPVSISSDDGVFTANTTANAVFSDAASGTFASTQTYDGDRAAGDVTAQSFQTTLSSIFEYDFMLSGEGSIRFQGDLSNSGPSFIGFTARINVFSEFMPGSGFTGSFFEQLFTDQTSAGSTPFDITVPLAASSGSYRIQIRLNHSGNSGLETLVESGSTTIDWAITAPNPCPADTNGNGSTDPGDFAAWVAAYNAGAPACDQNGDGNCAPDDFAAWVANYNAGC